jgi:ABC-type dipeptide/oligopeptide/nickel transport system permease component
MNRALAGRIALSSLISLVVLCVVSLIPTFLGTEADEYIVVRTAGFVTTMHNFADYLRAGEINRFMLGHTPREITDVIARNGRNSLFFIVPAALLATLYSFAAPLLRRVISRHSPEILAWIALVPIFIVATLLQSLALGVNQLLGFRALTLAYLGGQRMPVLLPALTMLLPIVAFSLRAAESGVRTIEEKEYIRAAVGRAVPEGSLWFRHVGSGLLDRLDDLLPRSGAAAIASLFITERVFNIPGITTMLLDFSYSHYFHYYPRRIVEELQPDGTVELVSRFGGGVSTMIVQFQVVIASALAIIALYILTVLICRLVISVLRRAIR